MKGPLQRSDGYIIKDKLALPHVAAIRITPNLTCTAKDREVTLVNPCFSFARASLLEDKNDRRNDSSDGLLDVGAELCERATACHSAEVRQLDGDLVRTNDFVDCVLVNR